MTREISKAKRICSRNVPLRKRKWLQAWIQQRKLWQYLYQKKQKVDLSYMAELTGKEIDTIKEELTGIIFQNPVTDRWEAADEYLSGNVRDKLQTAKIYAETTRNTT